MRKIRFASRTTCPFRHEIALVSRNEVIDRVFSRAPTRARNAQPLIVQRNAYLSSIRAYPWSAYHSKGPPEYQIVG
jgi:hypothetical protein